MKTGENIKIPSTMEGPLKSPRQGAKFQSPAEITSLPWDSSLATNQTITATRKQSAKAFAGNPHPIPNTVKDLDKKHMAMNYFELADTLRAQQLTKQHFHRLKLYPNTLTGNDITNWLISSGRALDGMEAEYLATELMGHGHIYNVLDEDALEFGDTSASALFRFALDDRVEFDVDSVDLDQVEALISRLVKKREMVVDDMTYRDVFCGLDAVELILQKGMVTSRNDAVKICATMLVNDVFLTVQVHGVGDADEFREEAESFYVLRGKTQAQDHKRADQPNSLTVPGDDHSTRSKHLRDRFVANRTFGGDAEVGSLRNLFAPLSPRRQSNAGAPNSMNKVGSRKDLVPPHESYLSRQQASNTRPIMKENIEDMNIVDGAEFVEDEEEIKLPALSPSAKTKAKPSPLNIATASTCSQAAATVAASRTKEFEDKHKSVNYGDLAADMRANLATAEHAFDSETFSNTLVGSDIVNWLIKTNHADDGEEAVHLGTRLLSQGHLFNVLDEEEQEFQGGAHLYRFMGRKVGITPISLDGLSGGNEATKSRPLNDQSGSESIEVRSIRNLLAPLSPRRQAAMAIIASKSMLSPRKRSSSRRNIDLGGDDWDAAAQLESSGSKEISADMGLASPRKKSSVKGLSALDTMTLKELDKKYKEMNYFVLTDALRAQVPTKHHLHRLKTYPNTLHGNEITHWLIASGYAPSLVEAEFLATMLMDHGHIYNVLDEDQEEFHGGKDQLFRFSVDDRIQFNIDSIDLDQVETFLFRSLKKKDMVSNDVTYRDVFCGCDAVELIILKGIVTIRTDAVKLCQKMLNSKVIIIAQTPGNRQEFFDEAECYYVLRDQDLHPSGGTAKPTPLNLGVEANDRTEPFEGSEVISLRNLFASMSPRKQVGGSTNGTGAAGNNSIIGSLQQIASKKGILSPRSLSRQHDQSSRSSRRENSRPGLIDDDRQSSNSSNRENSVPGINAESWQNSDSAERQRSRSRSDDVEGKNTNLPSSTVADSNSNPEYSRNASVAITHKDPSVQGIMSQKFFDELEAKYKDMDYRSLAKTLQEQLPTKQHTRHLKTYPNTLLGSDISHWLVTSGYAQTIPEAHFLGTELMSNGHMYNALDEVEQQFEGGHQLYRFGADRVEFDVASINLEEVEALLSRAVKKKDLVIKYMTYRDAFCGSDAVDLMVQQNMVATRNDAIQVFEKMLGFNSITIIQTTDNTNGFFDDVESFYSLHGRNRLGSRIGIGPTPQADTERDVKRSHTASKSRFDRGKSRGAAFAAAAVASVIPIPLSPTAAGQSSESSSRANSGNKPPSGTPAPLDVREGSQSPTKSRGRSASRIFGGGGESESGSGGGSIRSLLSILSPRRSTGASVTSPLQRMTKDKGGFLSPRKNSLSKQQAQSNR